MPNPTLEPELLLSAFICVMGCVLFHKISSLETQIERLSHGVVETTDQARDLPTARFADAGDDADDDGDDAAQPPTEFVCPITMELMRDPVCAMDGHT